MYGREAHLPIHITLQTNSEAHPEQELDLATRVERMLEIQKKLHVHANIQKALSNQKRQYDAKHSTHTKLKIGDKVLIESKKNEGRKGGKLEITFNGALYTIAEDVGKDDFILIMPKAKF